MIQTSSQCNTVAIKPYGATLFKASREGVWCSALKEFGESVMAESTVTARRPSLWWGWVVGRVSCLKGMRRSILELDVCWLYIHRKYISNYLYTTYADLRTYHKVWICIRDRYTYVYVLTYMHMMSTVCRRSQHNLNLIGLSVYFTSGINTFLAMGFVLYVSPCKNPGKSLFNIMIIWNDTFFLALLNFDFNQPFGVSGEYF